MRILIIGATSAIAHETAKFFARDGAELFLVGRTAAKLEDVSNDLKVRGAKRTETFPLDLSDLNLTILANYLEQQKRGCIAVVSSVAGDRGRRSNYVYGTAKGGVSIFLQGLRSRLSTSGVTVVTVKPGLVDSPMTTSLKKGLLFAQPAKVGKGIYKAMMKGKEVVYLPWFWRPIMAVVRSLPEPIFKKMPF